MYTTIEADIENGVIKGSELGKLPSHAHVLITLFDNTNKEKRPKVGTVTSGIVHMAPDAFKPTTTINEP